MEKFIYKWQNFILGLLVGIISGGTVVWFEMKDENRNFLSQILYELNTLKLEKKIQLDEIKKEKEKEEKPPKTSYIKIQKQKNENENIVATADSLQKISADSVLISLKISDSVSYDSSETAMFIDTSQSENIVVKKDKLIFSKTIKLKIKDESTANSTKKDSLISEISGMTKEEEKTDFYLEFWESPINYKGYKMANKKIILFGVEDSENVHLFQMDKKIYLKINEAVYHLEETYNFEPFKKITDKNLLVKIEK